MLFDFLQFEKMNQSNCIRLWGKNDIKCAKTFVMLTVAFGESTMSRTQVQLGYNRFKEGQDDDGSPSMSKKPMKTLKQ